MVWSRAASRSPVSRPPIMRPVVRLDGAAAGKLPAGGAVMLWGASAPVELRILVDGECLDPVTGFNFAGHFGCVL